MVWECGIHSDYFIDTEVLLLEKPQYLCFLKVALEALHYEIALACSIR